MTPSASSRGIEAGGAATKSVYGGPISGAIGVIKAHSLFLAAVAASLLAIHPLHAQGGPPMVTDDPGTPGNGRWEINLAWTEQVSPGPMLVGLPLLDANYGVGDRIQLNYQASWNLLQGSGQPTQSGMSDSQLAVKWRFLDEGADGLQVSMYPRYTFLGPGSDSDRRGAALEIPNFLMPFEVLRNFGFLSVNVDVGHVFSASSAERGWMGGVCVGHNLSKAWELDAEVHVNASEGLGENETLVNLGTRIDLSEHATILAAIGRDTGNSLGPRASLLTFLGIQLRL
jgi:hypothetical protein